MQCLLPVWRCAFQLQKYAKYFWRMILRELFCPHFQIPAYHQSLFCGMSTKISMGCFVVELRDSVVQIEGTEDYDQET